MTDPSVESTSAAVPRQFNAPSDHATVNAPVQGDVNNYYGAVTIAPDQAVHRQQVLDGLRSSVEVSMTEQVHTLTDRGLLDVPWTRHPGSVGAAGSAAAHRLANVQDLGEFVARGGALIVVGGSQSGKTTLSTRLVELVAARTDQQPVLFTLSTWNPRRTRLKSWMLEVLRANYGLDSVAQVRAGETALGDGTIIPIFDGFDEIDASFRRTAADAIRMLVHGGPAVITSIPLGADSAVLDSALPAAEVIELTAVGAGEVSRYLLLDVPKAERAQWTSITSRLAGEPTSAIGVALSSPLIAWLAKSVYITGSRSTLTARGTDATELLNERAFPTSAAIEEHLLGGLVAAVFARRVVSPAGSAAPAEEFASRDAERWLRFLSTHANRRIVAFWEIRRYAPLYRMSLVAAVILGVAVGWIGRTVPLLAGSVQLIMLAGLVFGFGFARGYSSGRSKDTTDPTRIGYNKTANKDGGLLQHTAKFLVALTAVIGAYAAYLATQIGRPVPAAASFGMSHRQLIAGLTLATVMALLAGATGGRIAARVLRGNPAFDAKTGARAADPLKAIASDRRSGAGMFATAGGMISVGYLILYLTLLPAGAAWAFAAVPLGAGIATFFWNEWACYKAAHVWLVVRDSLPWRLTDFLRACHDGGILRKNGNHFEFRHRRLQKSLAAQVRGNPADA